MSATHAARMSHPQYGCADTRGRNALKEASPSVLPDVSMVKWNGHPSWPTDTSARGRGNST
jgi:hypothetical protein